MSQYRLLGAVANFSHISKNTVARTGNYKQEKRIIFYIVIYEDLCSQLNLSQYTCHIKMKIDKL